MTEFQILTAPELVELAERVKIAALPEKVRESFRSAALLEIYALAVSTAKTVGDNATAEKAQRCAQELLDNGTGKNRGIWAFPSKIDATKTKIANGVKGEHTVDFLHGHDKAYVIFEEYTDRVVGLSKTGRRNLFAKLIKLVR
ncbi:MAG: hypothetical protein P4M13_01225 [Alphaproteobacteria bacterium]|nr:hypothetical protein [Alphaproteobacteria bacterium]